MGIPVNGTKIRQFSISQKGFEPINSDSWRGPCRFSKHDAIGEVRLPVCQMDLAQAKEIWKDLSSIVGDGKVSIIFYIYSFPNVD